MKKALKIGAVAMAIHCALNIGFMMGHAAPIAEGLVKGDFLTATALSRLNRRNYKRSKYLDIAEVIDYYACFMANTILAINGKKRRIKHR